MTEILELLEIADDMDKIYNLTQKSKSANAIELRNKAWQKEKRIPSWVDISSVGLDQFFTRKEVAEKCWKSFCEYIISDGANLSHYKFIEPSAGTGAFYDLLPSSRRLGIDVEQFKPDYIKSDFLTWEPKKNGYSYVCIGNPPFGYRAWLALIFLNHAAQFSDYVGFILPMGFQSRGKSNLIDRVRGLHLVHSSPLPQDSFINAYGKPVKVNALWQIWARNPNGKKLTVKTCNQYIDLFTVDLRKERLCGKKRMQEANFFLQRTFYNEPPILVENFNLVKYCCGYGIVIKRDKEKVTKILQNTDWRKYNNLASHNCKHISMCHIREALTDAGLVDE